ncbi:MAG: helix-turn-helix domain-containing protein [Candidatus Margulisbacteria bacterium]|nr:helix-turn-helix domain-containing protein [Candidatus Margulisiibacteriota bacterium]
MQVNSQKLARRIKALREDTGKSLNIFCFENDINKATQSLIEAGRNTNPKLQVLLKIARGLNTSVAELLQDIY